MMRRIVLFAALVAIFSALGSEGAFLTDEELEIEICYSAAAGYVSRVAVQSVPNNPIDILTIPGAHKKFQISCMEVFESGPVLAPSQISLCASPALLFICTAFISAPTDFTCESAPAYQTEQRVQYVIGGQNEEERHIKIQWRPQQTGVICFPRDLTFQLVGGPIVPEESNTAAVVAFIVIVVIVFCIVAFFITYQLRKVLRKFWKKQKARPAAHLSEVEQVNTLKALGQDPSPARSRGLPMKLANRAPDMYDEHHIYSSGPQYSVIEDGTLELSAQPLPKPWYMRAHYDLNKPPPQEDFDVPIDRIQRAESITRTPRQGNNSRATPTSRPARDGSREQSASFYRNMYDEQPYSNDHYSGRRARDVDQQPPPEMDYYDPDTGRPVTDSMEEEDDIVLTCTDCLLPIRGPDTPQYCRKTGKRHY